jgi:carbon monoxide dehydrogenase subunit G
LDSAFYIQGEAMLTASPDIVWQTVLKSEVLKACIPGCDQIQEVAPLRYEAQVRVGLGPIAARFSSQLSLTVIEPVSANRAAHFSLQAEGDAGRLGQAQAKIDIHLHPMAQGTRLTWSALPQLQGQLAQVGQRLTQISAKRLSQEFFIRLSAILGGEPLESVRRPRWSRLVHAFRCWWHRLIGKKGESR